jgi:hypothetical protein
MGTHAQTQRQVLTMLATGAVAGLQLLGAGPKVRPAHAQADAGVERATGASSQAP